MKNCRHPKGFSREYQVPSSLPRHHRKLRLWYFSGKSSRYWNLRNGRSRVQLCWGIENCFKKGETSVWEPMWEKGGGVEVVQFYFNFVWSIRLIFFPRFENLECCRGIYQGSKSHRGWKNNVYNVRCVSLVIAGCHHVIMHIDTCDPFISHPSDVIPFSTNALLVQLSLA